MTIFNDTNIKRVEKIQEILALLKKSAAANQPSDDQVWELLQPVIDDIGAMVGAKGQQADQDATGGPESASEPVSTPVPKETEPSWYSVQKMAQELPLKDLTPLVAAFLNRVDEELN